MTALIGIVSLASSLVAGQAPIAAAKATTPAKGWTPALAPDGHPDLQGVWVNFESTPFETNMDKDPRPLAAAADGTGASKDFDEHPGQRSARRPSQVVDPPSGRVPVMPWAEAKRDYDVAHLQDAWEHHSPWERCITRGVPGGMFPGGYGAGYQIFQTAEYVGILYEMIHEARIIPLDNRPHVASNIRLWNGDSRGHWEGNTLVVDIANYNNKGTIATNIAAGRMKGIPASEALHVVERFTPVDANTINYEVTIDDPKVYTSPWKLAVPLNRDGQYRIYEYACHEGNTAMPDTLSAGRATDKAAGETASRKNE